jgi:adenosylhomocysteine nucleosidase
VDTQRTKGTYPPSVIALVGLLFEARIVAGPGVLVFCRGRQFAHALACAIEEGCRSIISFGIAGGLSPGLRPGDWIVASAILSSEKRYTTDLALSRKFLDLIAGAEYAPIAGVDAPVVDPVAKQQIHRIGAAAVDMESHLAARLAAAHDLAFAAVRVVIDPAHRPVPTAAIVGMRPDGRTDVKAVLRELIASPRQAPLLARIALDALTARNALLKMRRRLGPGLGILDIT